jgi:hypothetical protein
MNPTTHCPLHLELKPLAGASASAALHILRMRYRQDGHMQVFLPTYVPGELLAMLQAGNAKAVHLETLEHEGAEQSTLPGWPDFVVLGVEDLEGNRIAVIPKSLNKLRTRRLLAGGVLCVAGGLLLAAAPWMGVAAFVLASHSIHKALRVPRAAFKGQIVKG